MRGSGDIFLPVSKARVGRQLGNQFNPVAMLGGMNGHGPAGISGIIQDLRAQSIRAVCQVSHDAALMAFSNKVQAISDGAVGKGFKNPPGQGGGDGGCCGLDELGLVGSVDGADHKTHRSEASEGVEVADGEGSDRGENHEPRANVGDAKPFLAAQLNFFADNLFQT